jgi:hypothetical protein
MEGAMRTGEALLALMAVAAIAVIPADILYTSRFVPRFKELERERIVTSNQLATAKIVSENLHHVRDLVYRNMDFAGQMDSLPPETQFFDFLTECINDLKMRLVFVHPMAPTVQGRVTTYGYEIGLEGDFFSFGELCSKLENSRRVMALTSFTVAQSERERSAAEPAPGGKGKGGAALSVPAKRPVSITIRLDTYRVKKG